jgi:hypothetical protein
MTDHFVTSKTFNPKFLTFSEFKKLNKDALRKTAYANYKYPSVSRPESLNFKIKGEFELSMENGGGGIPSVHERWYPEGEDMKRMFVRIPFAKGSEACDDLRKNIDSLVKHIQDNLATILGSKKEAESYELMHPIWEPQHDDDEDTKGKPKSKIVPTDSVKLRLETVYVKDREKSVKPTIKTKIMVKNAETGKLHRLVNPTIDEACQYIKLGSKFKCVLGVQKLSGALTVAKGLKKKQLLLILVVKQLVVTHVDSSKSIQDEFKQSAWSDDEMEEDEATATTKTQVLQTKLASENEADSDAEPPVRKAVVRNESDDEESKKPSKHKVTTEESDSDKSEKESDSNSDSDSDSESKANAKKSKAKSQVKKAKK